MEGAERSDHYFMNVKDIINLAFGELDGNVVNFRLVRIILYLLARQLRILERRVEVNVPIGILESSSSFSVTEVKVHAITKKVTKRDAKSIKHGTEEAGERSSISRSSAEDRREDREYKKAKGGRDFKEGKTDKGTRGQIEGRDGREGREYSEGKDKESRGGKSSREHKEGKETDERREDKESRARKDSPDRKESKDRKEGKERKEGKSGKEYQDGKEDGERKSRKEGKKGKELPQDGYESSSNAISEDSGDDTSHPSKGSKDKKGGKHSKMEKSGKGSKLAKDSETGTETKLGKEGPSGKESRSGKDSQSGKESEIGKESRTGKESKLGKRSQTGKEGRLGKDSETDKESKQEKDGQIDKKSKLDKDSQLDKDSRSGKDSRTGKGTKHDKEGKARKSAKGGKEDTDEDSGGDYDGKVDRDDKDSRGRKHTREDKDVDRNKESGTSKEGKESKGRTKGKESRDKKRAGGYEEDEESLDDMDSKVDKKGKTGKQRKEGKVDDEDKDTETGKRTKQGKTGKEKYSSDKKQRADSYEQPDESPTPMASVDEMVTQHEKLLVDLKDRYLGCYFIGLESLTSEEISHRGTRTPRMSVVTQEEFMKLANVVDRLCTRFNLGDSEDALLMEELYKRTSYTEAMSALQLSARLEATERLLGRMVAAIGTIARTTPGVQLDDETKGILDAHGVTPQKPEKARKGKEKKTSPKKGKGAKGGTAQDDFMPPPLTDDSATAIPYESKAKPDKTETEGFKQDCVTYMDLDSELRKLSNEMIKQVTAITTRNVQTADRAYKIASGLEGKLDSSLDVGPRMITLESQVATYADQINALDTGLTSQMINYQEQLTQMQHELEVGLEAMAEALTNAQGADTLAVAELNTNFITLQTEQESMVWQQRDLQQSHDHLAADLASLWKQIELLRDTKSDRDEVTDALRDKAGIKDLNGLVSLEQFDAVRGDLEKRIASAYDKFNNQEIIWQKAIDDMLRELGEKADLIQLYGLRDEINKYLSAMRSRVQFISDIVGEPKAAIVSRKLFRDTVCISCSSPASMEVEEFDIPPALPKFPDRKKTDAERMDEKNQIKGDGDHKTCYPGLPIPHPRHPKAHICTRYCGGSHTLIPSGPPKVPPSTIITPLTREVTIEPGTDGKMYQVEMVPCLPCKVAAGSPPPPSTPILIEPMDSADHEQVDTADNDGMVQPNEPIGTTTPVSGNATPPAMDEEIMNL